jgi:hypothetical protein
VIRTPKARRKGKTATDSGADAVGDAPLTPVMDHGSLDDHYRSIERRLPLHRSPEYGLLVTPNGNSNAPIHRWFHLKEAFSSALLHRILKDTDLRDRTELRIVDPYAGVGTTLLSASDAIATGQLRHATAYGIECNPFLHLVASTKVKATQNPPTGLLSLTRKLAATASREADIKVDVPALSTFHSPEYFDTTELRRLLLLRDAIEAESQAGASPDLIALCRLALGAIVEPVSNLRRDGRALRYVPKKTPRVTAVQAFLDKADQIEADLGAVRSPLRGAVLSGDGRTLSPLDGRYHDFDLALFSPPYPNNIDYTEVYKMENWLLGFISSSQEFSAQRLKTLYSHPSLLRDDPLPSTLLEAPENRVVIRIVEPLIADLPSDRYASARTRMIRGYALDMYLTLRNLSSRLTPGGYVVYIVGNSIHGNGSASVVIAADLLIAQLARALGYDVVRIDVARQLKRRFVDSEYLRESVVTLRVGS